MALQLVAPGLVDPSDNVGGPKGLQATPASGTCNGTRSLPLVW